MANNDVALKMPFTLLVLAATILTGISMFTPGWRYTADVNEGVITGHYGERLGWENWVMALMILAFILEIITLIGGIGGFFKNATPGFLAAATLLTILPIIFLAVASIIYAINYDYTAAHIPAAVVTVTPLREAIGTTRATVIAPIEGNPFARATQISLGYSFWLAPIAIIPLLIAAILYLVPAIRRGKDGYATHEHVRTYETRQVISS